MRRTRRPRLAALVVVVVAVWLGSSTALLTGMSMVAVLGGALAGGCAGDGGPGGGARQLGDRSWSAEQTDNAQTIVQVAVSRQLPRRAAVVAVSTAIVESALRNMSHGHADSLGLFQQRPSQGWGPPETVLNPALAAAAFFDRLTLVPGWATMAPGVAAQTVQRSAFPHRYAPAERAAAALVAYLWPGPDESTPEDPQAAAAATLRCADQGAADVVPARAEDPTPRGGPQRSPARVAKDRVPAGFTLPADPRQRAAVAYAISKISRPYVWGAKGPDAFDCSGLMTAAWAAAGVPVPAGTVTQKTAGTPVELSRVAPGDLLLIPGSLGSPRNPRHVGMYIGHGLVVDAHDSRSGVIVSPLSSWTPKIVTIRHIAGPSGGSAARAA
ncbi:C40 family peptidase [Pseudonocardia sp. N23]|uniref:C40 family peptidase n=1 Tax=Pseudonocardia sp. N23 TaxID=1987376 RepID=UPI000C02FDCE|nr:C40 family peptidase [Pseudonocardia sp. N23]GAY13158.1 putative secreted protein [Pseudonocardia sp. N23]